MGVRTFQARLYAARIHGSRNIDETLARGAAAILFGSRLLLGAKAVADALGMADRLLYPLPAGKREAWSPCAAACGPLPHGIRPSLLSTGIKRAVSCGFMLV